MDCTAKTPLRASLYIEGFPSFGISARENLAGASANRAATARRGAPSADLARLVALLAAQTLERHLHGAWRLLVRPVLRLHPLFGGEESLRGLLVGDAAQLDEQADAAKEQAMAETAAQMDELTDNAIKELKEKGIL